jgi:hypothetical protein
MSYRTCVTDYVKGMKGKKLAWPPSPPPSPPLHGVGMGGGGVLSGLVLPGNSERGRGVTLVSFFWQAIMAPHLGG